MAVIGNNNIGGSTANDTNALQHHLEDGASLSYVAAADQEVFKLWIYVGVSYSGDGSGVELAVYDITAGTANAPIVSGTSATIGSLTLNSWNSISITPVGLVQGNTYAIGFRVISATSIKLHKDYVGGGVSRSSLTGTSSLAATWTDSATGGAAYSMYAETQTAAAGTSIPVIMNHLRNQGIS